MGAALLPATRPGLVGGGAAIAIVVLGMVRALNERELAGLPVGNLLVGLIALAVGYRAARDAVGAASRPGAGLTAGLAAGLFLAVFMLFTRVPGVSDKLVQTAPEDTDAILFGLGAGGAGIIVLAGLGLGLVGGALAALPPPPARLRGALPQTGSGRRRLAPGTLLGLLIVALALIAAPMFAGQYWNHVSTSVGIFVLMGLGLNVVVGYAGLLDLGYVAFFAIGAYAMAILSSPEQGIEMNFWLALPIAMAVSGVSGTLLGIPVLRMRGDYLAIVTLGFGEIIRIFSQNLTDLTGGPRPSPSGDFGLADIDEHHGIDAHWFEDDNIGSKIVICWIGMWAFVGHMFRSNAKQHLLSNTGTVAVHTVRRYSKRQIFHQPDGQTAVRGFDMARKEIHRRRADEGSHE